MKQVAHPAGAQGNMHIVFSALRDQSASSTFPITSNRHLSSRLIIHTTSEMVVIPYEEILCCRAESNYTSVVKKDGSSVLVSKPLKWVASQLPCFGAQCDAEARFLRVHQTHLVDIAAVRSIEKGTIWQCHLENGQVVPVARARRSEVVAIFSA